MGHEDLGKHLEATGNLSDAAEAYAKMRPEVSTPKHIVEVGKHLASVALQRRDWGLLLSNVGKLWGMQNSEEDKGLQPYVRVLSGVALMGQERYAEAALEFLETDHAAGSTQYGDLFTPNDVATYGGLLALATMDRKVLRSQVLDNSNFRNFLELEPHVRKAITQFVGGRYSACLRILDSYKADYLLDLYLQKHVASLYSQIRTKCIVQYLAPFSCVTLSSMSSAFTVSDDKMEAELIDMIKAGTLKARVDAIGKVSLPTNCGLVLLLIVWLQLVTMGSGNARLKMQTSTLDAAKNYEKEALARIRLMSITAAELEIRGKKAAGSAAPTSFDKQYEEIAAALA
jgi:COP9 signalosome complex subunit 1